MSKEKTYPNVEIRRVANGWIVYPGGNYRMNSDGVINQSEIRVFETWERCEQFLFNITDEAV